jgi:hypothetical protein
MGVSKMRFIIDHWFYFAFSAFLVFILVGISMVNAKPMSKKEEDLDNETFI